MMSASSAVTLQVRAEVFDHGVYPPVSASFNIVVLTSIIKELHGASSIEYKITKQQWCEKVAKKIPSLTQKDAEVYFATFKALFSDLETPPSPLKAGKTGANLSESLDNIVDIRYFAVYMWTQLFTQSVKSSTEVRKNMSNTPWPSYNSSPMSPGMASPRSKATNVQYTQSDYQLEFQFVKCNIKQILNLISTETHSIDLIALTASDLNSLRVLLSPVRSDGSIATQPLSSFAPFFAGTSAGAKVKLPTIVDWVTGILSTKRSINIVEVHNLCKAVTIYEDEFLDKDVRIANCEECYIYINTAASSVLISNCTNCTIMVAAVATICTLDKSERVTLSAAANIVRAGNSVDCKLNLYLAMSPILYGDNRYILLGPHNVAYDELVGHIKHSKISSSISNLENWRSPMLLKSEKDWYSLQAEKDFTKLELPAKFRDNAHILAPGKYLETLNSRSKTMGEIMEAIKKANLTPEQQVHLHNAIQGHFREWVASTREVKSIEGLVKMMDDTMFKNE